MSWRRTVMVVDDSSTMLKIVGDMLADNDYQPILINDMKQALTVNIKDMVHTALVDLVMPGMNGIQGIRALRSISSKLKIIAMSSGDASNDPYRLLRVARRVGADAIIEKPFKVEELTDLLNNVDEISGLGCVRVLVIDDSPTICKIVSKMVHGDRYRVVTANSGKEALDRTDILGIDLVLTDIFMPGESGIEVIQRVRTNWPDVKIIAMSAGHEDQMQSTKALAAAEKIGADATLSKPFSKDDLLKLLDDMTIDL